MACQSGVNTLAKGVLGAASVRQLHAAARVHACEVEGLGLGQLRLLSKILAKKIFKYAFRALHCQLVGVGTVLGLGTSLA